VPEPVNVALGMFGGVFGMIGLVRLGARKFKADDVKPQV
jgi:hypothetical protein